MRGELEVAKEIVESFWSGKLKETDSKEVIAELFRVKHGKEHRKPYHGAKAVDKWCRNHNYCWICRRNRLHKKLVEQIKVKDELGGEK